MTLAQALEQIPIFLRMVEAFRDGIEVIDHRAKHGEVRFGAAIANLAHEVQHAVQHRGNRPMLVLDDSDRLQLPSPADRLRRKTPVSGRKALTPGPKAPTLGQC